MDSIADGWWNEDRRDLFHSVEVLASDARSVERLGTALDTVLNDLELYDDPRQGAGAWLFDTELELADKLGDQLHAAVGDAPPLDAGAIALASGEWPNVRATAGTLIRLMEANGDFSR
ncbi:hypothetical protein [Sphingomonas sp. URHD0057]|uniref:hypothetical protein n=1 Tax=Sphingomonas sp. URHD0057 TaxID=1380389 RepID=UPI00048F1D04|nr:hypothetical protein [Sphingomonas sp. URHD0057]